ncbi:hypothetical protein HaLaN_26452, partial [Haematococcus lacustris]
MFGGPDQHTTLCVLLRRCPRRCPGAYLVSTRADLHAHIIAVSAANELAQLKQPPASDRTAMPHTGDCACYSSLQDQLFVASIAAACGLPA